MGEPLYTIRIAAALAVAASTALLASAEPAQTPFQPPPAAYSSAAVSFPVVVDDETVDARRVEVRAHRAGARTSSVETAAAPAVAAVRPAAPSVPLARAATPTRKPARARPADATVRQPAVLEVNTAAPNVRAAAAVAFAKQQVGDRYRYGATGPDVWDCSGLTQGSWAQGGVKLPHQSGAQARMGRAVTRAQLQPGDLIIWTKPAPHVAIYIGGGQVVAATTPRGGVKQQRIWGNPIAYRRLIG